MDYEIVKLKEIADFNKESIGKNSNYEFINYLDTANITNGAIDTIVRMPIEDAPSRAKRIVHNNDIVYSTVRPNLCHYGILDSPVENMIVSTGFTVISCKDDVNPYYVYNYLTQNDITSQLHSIAENSTSAYPSIKPSDLESIEIKLPKLDIQNKIAKILTDIDKKIKINNEINNNLYQLIKNNYESLIASGEWKEVELGTISNITSGKRPIDKLEVGEYPVIGANGIMAYTNDYNFNEDLIITGRVGTLGIVKRYSDYIWASDNTLVIQTKYLNYVESYLKTIDYYSLNRGSTQPLLTQGDLKKQIISFNENLVIKFEKDNQIFIDKIRNNDKESKRLEHLRDTLLPKLINGEIDLDNIEI